MLQTSTVGEDTPRWNHVWRLHLLRSSTHCAPLAPKRVAMVFDVRKPFLPSNPPALQKWSPHHRTVMPDATFYQHSWSLVIVCKNLGGPRGTSHPRRQLGVCPNRIPDWSQGVATCNGPIGGAESGEKEERLWISKYDPLTRRLKLMAERIFFCFDISGVLLSGPPRYSRFSRSRFEVLRATHQQRGAP